MLEFEDEYEEKSWSKKLLGRDVPCLENSFLCGFTSGTFTGLAGFLYTSRANLSFNLGFCTYILATFVYWVKCRYKYESSHQLAERRKDLFLQSAEPNEVNQESEVHADENQNKELKK